MQSKRSKTSKEKKDWIIHQIIRYAVLAFVVVFAYWITGVFGVDQRIRGCIMGLITLGSIRHFKVTRLLPQDFLETPKLDAIVPKIITITICVLAVITLIYVVAVLFFMER